MIKKQLWVNCVALLTLVCSGLSYAVEQLPNNLTSIYKRASAGLIKHNLNLNLLKLLANFTTQKNFGYCGIASAVMVLNAALIDAPAYGVYFPYHYFDQDNIFNSQAKQVIAPAQVSKNGVTLMQLSQIIAVNGLHNTPVFAKKLQLPQFTQLIKRALRQQKFVIVNFFRPMMHLKGLGHHSPIAAYDAQTDQFLILDVSRYKYPPYWVKAQQLWLATSFKQDGQERGLIIIDNSQAH